MCIIMRDMADIEESRARSLTADHPPVSSYNEWDPLEEVIVGRLEGAAIPPWHDIVRATMPKRESRLFRERGGQAFTDEELAPGIAELDGFVKLLEQAGIRVRRPERLRHDRPFATPSWQSEGGSYAAMPRDLLMVVGDQLFEAPLAWRSRHFEIAAFRPLLREYFEAGARWVSAPPPLLDDDLYVRDHHESDDPEHINYAITEHEPTFDAADFIRCGRDLFVQRSHVTNLAGIEWMRRHIGDEYRIHEVKIHDHSPMHIDASFMPLAPGKLLINPERVRHIPPMFETWDVIVAPPPTLPDSHPLYMSSAWVSMNVFMLDEDRVVVERQELPLIRELSAHGFECIACDFRNVMSFGGAFHCVTLDVRRRGTLQSYF
jgi:glycine amidinotransferase